MARQKVMTWMTRASSSWSMRINQPLLCTEHHGNHWVLVPGVMSLATSPQPSPKCCDTKAVCGPSANPALPSAHLQNVDWRLMEQRHMGMSQAILEHPAEWCLFAIHPFYFSPVTTSKIFFFLADMTKTKTVSTLRITDSYEDFTMVPRKHPGLKTVSKIMK